MRGDIPRYGRNKIYYIGNVAKFRFQKKFKKVTDRIHEVFMAIGSLYNPSKELVINEDVHFDEVSC